MAPVPFSCHVEVGTCKRGTEKTILYFPDFLKEVVLFCALASVMDIFIFFCLFYFALK